MSCKTLKLTVWTTLTKVSEKAVMHSTLCRNCISQRWCNSVHTYKTKYLKMSCGHWETILIKHKYIPKSVKFQNLPLLSLRTWGLEFFPWWPGLEFFPWGPGLEFDKHRYISNLFVTPLPPIIVFLNHPSSRAEECQQKNVVGDIKYESNPK